MLRNHNVVRLGEVGIKYPVGIQGENMLLQWQEKDEFGNEVTKNDPRLSVKNAATYAKKNCRHCHARGVEYWDNGWESYLRETNNDSKDFCGVEVYQVMDRKPINPRIITCDCVLRTIEKAGL